MSRNYWKENLKQFKKEGKSMKKEEGKKQLKNEGMSMKKEKGKKRI